MGTAWPWDLPSGSACSLCRAAVVGTSFPFRGGRYSPWGVTLEVAFVTSDAEVNMDVGRLG